MLRDQLELAYNTRRRISSKILSVATTIFGQELIHRTSRIKKGAKFLHYPKFPNIPSWIDAISLSRMWNLNINGFEMF